MLSFQASQVGKKSELLPAGWSSDSTVYTLLYQPADGTDTHLLKVIRMEESLLVHFMVNFEYFHDFYYILKAYCKTSVTPAC